MTYKYVVVLESLPVKTKGKTASIEPFRSFQLLIYNAPISNVCRNKIAKNVFLQIN